MDNQQRAPHQVFPWEAGVILVSRIAGTPIHAGFAVGVDWAGKGKITNMKGSLGRDINWHKLFIVTMNLEKLSSVINLYVNQQYLSELS